MTKVLGLTGGIATGKSTVSRIFKEQGVPVIDADIGARMVVEPGMAGLKEVERYFGQEVMNPDGSLNRKKLGDIVFQDKNKRLELNQLLGQFIRSWISSEKEKALSNRPDLIVLDIPLLYEENYTDEVDKVMVVATTEEVQQKRLMQRDGINQETANLKINSQLPIKQKVAMADYVIDNNGSQDNTRQQVLDWLKEQKNT